ncbi:MAG: Jag N-terminal domain-containing protein [Christensenellales bacterium]
MKIKEFTGKTTKEAIDNGLAELGVTIADVHVDVLQEGAKGLFGLFGSKPACVRLTVMDDEREDDHGLSDLLGSFSLSNQKKKSAAKPAAPKAEAPKPEAKPECQGRGEAGNEAGKKPRRSRRPSPPRRRPKSSRAPRPKLGCGKEAGSAEAAA